jgi:hypothetical protein
VPEDIALECPSETVLSHSSYLMYIEIGESDSPHWVGQNSVDGKWPVEMRYGGCASIEDYMRNIRVSIQGFQLDQTEDRSHLGAGRELHTFPQPSRRIQKFSVGKPDLMGASR